MAYWNPIGQQQCNMSSYCTGRRANNCLLSRTIQKKYFVFGFGIIPLFDWAKLSPSNGTILPFQSCIYMAKFKTLVTPLKTNDKHACCSYLTTTIIRQSTLCNEAKSPFNTSAPLNKHTHTHTHTHSSSMKNHDKSLKTKYTRYCSTLS